MIAPEFVVEGASAHVHDVPTRENPGDPPNTTDATDPSAGDESGGTRTRTRRILQPAALAIPLVVLAVLAWTHRSMFYDGYIYLHVVQNILAGHGPVFNSGQRVEAFTSPLWTAMLAVVAVATPFSLTRVEHRAVPGENVLHDVEVDVAVVEHRPVGPSQHGQNDERYGQRHDLEQSAYGRSRAAAGGTPRPARIGVADGDVSGPAFDHELRCDHLELTFLVGKSAHRSLPRGGIGPQGRAGPPPSVDVIPVCPADTSNHRPASMRT